MRIRLTSYVLRILILLGWMSFAGSQGTRTANAAADGGSSEQVGYVKSEFLFENPSFRSCHASTIVETGSGLVAAWFGGTAEGKLDVGIWMSRHDGQKWSEPVEVANGSDEKKRIQYPCWNPVLFQPKMGPLFLFYKVGPSPSSWWGMLMTSTDNGRTWSDSKRLPNGILGPIRNKPVELMGGLVLSGSSTENAGWQVHMERGSTSGRSWSRTERLNGAMEFSAIQPTILAHGTDAIQILCRTKQRRISESWSENGGETWGRMTATELPNPNSAIDAVLLRDGRSLLVYNHSDRSREILNVAISPTGKRWYAALVLENEPGSEFSYPAVIQTRDGSVHITYTWKRERIKHVVVDPFKLSLREIVEGQWR